MQELLHQVHRAQRDSNRTIEGRLPGSFDVNVTFPHVSDIGRRLILAAEIKQQKIAVLTSGWNTIVCKLRQTNCAGLSDFGVG